MSKGDPAEFARLFEEFVKAYPATPEGQEHIRLYERGRAEGRRNYEEIVAAADRGEDVTDQILLRLLPYADSVRNRGLDVWVHIAPVFTTDIRKKFEAAGWTKAEDWPHVAQAVLDFVRRCNENSLELQAACDEFARSPYSTGLQTGTLTPILNALRPDDFILVNNKSRSTINYFAGTSYKQALTDYPGANATGHELVESLSAVMHRFDVPALSDADLFDMFSHWLVAVKKFDFGRRRTIPPSSSLGQRQPFEPAVKEPQYSHERTVRYWKISPGDHAWNWDACREQGFIAMGWDEIGDLSKLTREEYEELRARLMTKHQGESGWSKAGVDQTWHFHNISPGDRIVANRGKREVLGIGTVVGPYYFVEDERHGHRLPVKWDDLTVRQVNEPGWQRTLVELDRDKFVAIRDAAPISPGTSDTKVAEGKSTYAPEPFAGGYFSSITFQLLAELHANPSKDFYQAHREEFRTQLEEPFQRLFRDVAEQLPSEITEVMETEKRVFSRITKNDFGQGGAWDHYWAAFYPKGSKRTEGAQLSMWINHERFEVGFYIGHYGGTQRRRFVRNCSENGQGLTRLLEDILSDPQFVFGRHEDTEIAADGTVRNRLGLTWQDWLRDPEQAGFDVSVIYPRDRLLRFDARELAEETGQIYARLFPLVLVAISDDPVPDIIEYLGVGSSGEEELEPNPEFTLSQCALETGIEEEMLARWVRAIERKGQAILYGPPGTGKTYVAEHLARHLIGSSNGFIELVQFHPAYAYEDFIQGIRPKRLEEGGLDYPTVPGRFLEFCREARKRKGPCVLIIDEINRANLARVFGELMYLLEYREREVPLATGGSLRIPANVRLIGTMNTADRSIALVDHALRRRFAFLALYPDYGILRHYHQTTGFDVEPLITVLSKLNRQIGDRHYEVGVTFFLRQDLAEQVEDIWRMEIEPYLEEYFFDQPDKVDAFRWDKVGKEITVML